MNAIISGSAGVALLVDGESLFSIDIDRLDEIVPRGRREVPYLFGDAQDQQIVEGVDAEAVKRLLDDAWRGAEALELALILMDGELSDETREIAATELAAALAVTGTTERVEAVLWSRPLPASANVDGAVMLCARVSATAATALLERAQARQAAIREIWEAFERVPEPVFGPDVGDRARSRSALVRDGVFRELVAARADGKSMGTAALLVWVLRSRGKASSDNDALAMPEGTAGGALMDQVRSEPNRLGDAAARAERMRADRQRMLARPPYEKKKAA